MFSPAPAEGEVHVWRVSLEPAEDLAAEVLAFLSADERERAGRFVRSRDRDHFVAARGSLRAILARTLPESEPRELRFRYGPRGKPSLTGGPAEDDLRFSISHSHDLALCAVTSRCEIGIDLEQVHLDLDFEAISERFFSPLEVRSLLAVPWHLRTQAFFRCWTRKEAYVKARGLGFSLPLDRFSVSVSPGEPPALRLVEEGTPACSRWSILDLDPAPGYVAALAVDGPVSRLELRDWPCDR